ncbi:MAG: hypothetical protein KKH68_12600 [Proteobacteria bacterium]|nr:hypothetical protein [Pseudomonadota bacterium]
MTKKDWKKPFAIILLIMLLGGYYERLSVEIQAMVLPLAIFIAAGIVMGRFKQLEYEIRSLKINAREVVVQTLSVIDDKGRERVSISTAPNTALMTFFDENHISCASLELLHKDPVLKLEGGKGSAWIAFNEEGIPNLILKNDSDETLWSAL